MFASPPLVIAVLLGLLQARADGLDNGLARTPVLAWSSWYSLNDTKLNESAVQQNADILAASGLVAAGYRYMILDDGWEAPARDEDGYLHGNPERFPSGMQRLVHYVASKGIGLGLYTTPGNYTCLENPASYGHTKKDVELWVSTWGISYLKDCQCNTTRELREHAYNDMEAALNASGRAVVFECDPPYTDGLWSTVAQVCNLWAAHDDIEDTFLAWTGALDDMEAWDLRQWARPGAWNLPDILRVGEGGQSWGEYRAQVGMYAILAAPFIIGTDLRTADPRALDLYGHPEVLAIQQDARGEQGRRVGPRGPDSGGVGVWIRPLAGGELVLGLLNRGAGAVEAKVLLVTLGLPPNSTVSVRDVWDRKQLPDAHGSVGAHVEAHACLLLRLRPT